MRILIVDDSMTMRQIILNAIEAQWPDADVIEAGDVPQGRAILARPDHGVGLVLLDLHLPEEDGTVLLAEMKADAALAGIPVLIVTADAGKFSMIQALSAGASGYLVKPVTEADLRKEIGRFFPAANDSDNE